MKQRITLVAGMICILVAALIGFSFGDREGTRLMGPTATPSGWESIPLPNGQIPDHFIDSPAPYAQVIANDGKVYHHPCFLWDGLWEEGEIKNGVEGSCSSSKGTWAHNISFPDPPRTVVSQSYCVLASMSLSGKTCLYVILDNGELLRWEKLVWLGPGEQPTPVKNVPATYSETVFSCTVFGGMVGLLLFSVGAWGMKHRRSK